MPSHIVHKYINRLYFGRTFPRLHKVLDDPVKYFGRGHRILFHAYDWAMYLARKTYPGDPDARVSAILHVDYDNMCSRDPDYKKCLEDMAKKEVKERKKARQYNSQLERMIKENEKRRKLRMKKLKAELDKTFESSKPKKKRRKKTNVQLQIIVFT